MFTTFKRWTLQDGARESELVALVREAILPAYNRLAGCFGIGLLRIEGSHSYLATQYWESRAARDSAVSSESYAKWWSDYLPVLARWDEMMTFEDEWETEELIPTQIEDRETPVRQAVEAFYSAFAENFAGACDFSTEDWNHINPGGGWTRGREDVLKEVREVHTMFLKDVTETIEDITVRFAVSDTAVVTVLSLTSPFVTPDGVNHDNERHIRTFVVVKRDGRWLVMQDQNTRVIGV